jgi:hypothetical protein
MNSLLSTDRHADGASYLRQHQEEKVFSPITSIGKETWICEQIM